MGKKIIRVPRKTQPYKCKKCRKMVEVNHAVPRITETEDTILYGWDCGHKHQKTFQVHMVDGEQQVYPIYLD